MDESLEAWTAEYHRVRESIRPYFDFINQKVIQRPAAPISERERVFYDLYLYWNAVLNSGDIFSHFAGIQKNLADLKIIGAHGTLKALDGLLPYYLKHQECPDQAAAGNYFWDTKAARDEIERCAEGTIEFAELLLNYAHKNLFKEVRPEEPRDIAAIAQLLRASFPADSEARLVELLRAAKNLVISLVAVADDTIVGHVAFSPVRAAGAKFGAGLAPLAVLESHRHRGIAAALVEHGLAACHAAGFHWVAVLGEPEYYARFGFRPAKEFGLSDEYGGGAAFQVLELKHGGIPRHAGLVKYAPEFASLGE